MEASYEQVSLGQAATINLVCRFEATARLVDKLIADNPDRPPAEIISDLKIAAWAAQQRNATLAKLGLNDTNVDGADPWDALDNAQHAQRQGDGPSTDPADNATAGDTGDGMANGGQPGE